MPRTESEAEIRNILDSNWEDIAYFAFDGFHHNGRGVVAVEKTDGGVRKEYVRYDYQAGKPDDRTASMINDYDPKNEIVLQYLTSSGQVHTLLLQTAPAARPPWRIWLFEKLAAEERAEKNGAAKEDEENE